MASSDFVQKKELFSFSATECLRNAYFHNDCQICIELCPEDAFALVRNKLTLFENKCIECAACIGSCPTESLHIENFDPNTFTLAFNESEAKILTCKINTPCLGIFDSHHFISMALRSDETPICDMSHCEGCVLNSEKKVEMAIRQKIEQSNAFLVKVELEKEIATIEENLDEENSRRALFRTAFTKAKDVIKEGDHEKPITTLNQHHVETALPLKYTILKNSIKETIESFTITSFEGFDNLFFNKKIDFNACTNCGDCIQFCPTDALFATSDKQGIFFTAGKCIGCGICDDICKTDAVTTKEGIDLVSIAFDRGSELVHYEMVMCHECRCPYPYKGGDPICNRCKDFKNNFENMFVLAKDQ